MGEVGLGYGMANAGSEVQSLLRDVVEVAGDEPPTSNN